MKSSIHTRYVDTAKPLPFQMRYARWLTDNPEDPPAEDPPADDPPAEDPPGEDPKTPPADEDPEKRRLKNENQNLRRRLREAETALEEALKAIPEAEGALEEFKTKNAELERKLLAVQVAADKGLPKGYAERLRGATQAELEADADWFIQNGVSAGDGDDDPEPRGGLNPKRRRGSSTAAAADELVERATSAPLL